VAIAVLDNHWLESGNEATAGARKVMLVIEIGRHGCAVTLTCLYSFLDYGMIGLELAKYKFLKSLIGRKEVIEGNELKSGRLTI
jgi:hypothetical protein